MSHRLARMGAPNTAWRRYVLTPQASALSPASDAIAIPRKITLPEGHYFTAKKILVAKMGDYDDMLIAGQYWLCRRADARHGSASLDSAQRLRFILLPAIGWLKKEACCCAAAGLPHMRAATDAFTPLFELTATTQYRHADE